MNAPLFVAVKSDTGNADYPADAANVGMVSLVLAGCDFLLHSEQFQPE